jgi:UDP:flavonoid glycosyltransferase YjiC (YdhE family)
MKVLAMANAHALAHVSRLLEIAKSLRRRGHELLFAGHGKYLGVAEREGFPTRELPYVPVERLVRIVRTQKLWELYPEPELEAFMAAELELYEAFRPDLVMLDNRPTARTSAERAGLKTAGVLNVHMSNYRQIPFFSYVQLAGGRNLPGLVLADRLENRLEYRLYDRLVMGGLNRIRRRLGLRRLYAYEHEEGDIALLADLPEFNPAGPLPARARYVGPLTWRNTLPAPACLDRLNPDLPTVYFTLGSEGLEELVAHLGGLARHRIQVVVATGAADLASKAPPTEGVFLESYVNTELLLPRCDLVCCHGGNGTLYQALRHGLPCVVVATHAEQYYGGKRIQQLGLGRALTLKKLQGLGMAHLVGLIREVLANGEYRRRAEAFSGHFQSWHGAELAADAVECLVIPSGR